MRLQRSVRLSTACVGLFLLAGCDSTPKGSDPAAPASGAAPNSPAANPQQAAVPPPPPPAPKPVLRLAEGTPIRVRTTTALSTKTAQAGEAFAATLAEPLMSGANVIAPRGARVTGVVAAADPGGRVQGRASLSVRLTSVEVNGREIGIQTNSFTRAAPGTKKKDAVKVGVASGIGAAIGAIAGGGQGAAIGAGVGAGAGTGAVMATRGDPAVIGAETLISFRLQSPVEIR